MYLFICRKMMHSSCYNVVKTKLQYGCFHFGSKLIFFYYKNYMISLKLEFKIFMREIEHMKIIK